MAAPTPKQLAAAQRRKLKTMKASLLDMASAWGDVDEYCISSLTELANRVQDVSDQLVDSQ